MEDVRIKFNNTPIRKDTEKLLPSGRGVTPGHIYNFPEAYGLTDQLLSVDTTLISELKAELGGDGILDFVSPEFSAIAEQAYTQINSPSVTLGNVWFIFSSLLPKVVASLPADPRDIVNIAVDI